MLAQNFMSAADLNLTEEQLSVLIKTLVLFETGKLKHVIPKPWAYNRNTPESFSGSFNMNFWSKTYKECGTVACIGGTAELVAGRSEGAPLFNGDVIVRNKKLFDLFYPRFKEYLYITVEQAARALRNFLTTGDADWYSLGVTSPIDPIFEVNI